MESNDLALIACCSRLISVALKSGRRTSPPLPNRWLRRWTAASNLHITVLAGDDRADEYQVRVHAYRAAVGTGGCTGKPILSLDVSLGRTCLSNRFAAHFANSDENVQRIDEEIVLAALDATEDEKLTSLALRIVLSDHVAIPHESQPDLLTEAEQFFAPNKPKTANAKAKRARKDRSMVKDSAKKEAARRKAA